MYNKMLRGAAAAMFVLVVSVHAHEGEDHSHASDMPASLSSGPVGSAPQRLADGSLFVPKNVQRRLGIRTAIAESAALARTIELSGVVMAEPNAGGKVQAGQMGRVEPGPNGLPALGQRVRKGEVLAYLRPLADSFERGSRQAQVAELAAQREIAQKRVARLEQLEGLVPQKEIEAARLELQSLAQREEAIGRALNRPETLTAPVSGVVGAAHVVAGQLVDARELLFEIVDPQRMAIEALSYDPALAAAIKTASAATPGGEVRLKFLGGGRVLRDQALPLLFKVTSTTTPLAIGQPAKVIAQTAQSIQGVAVPDAAIVKDASGDNIVWVHTEPERFEPRRVRYQALDAKRAAVTDGLRGGERVVVAGASVLGQVR